MKRLFLISPLVLLLAISCQLGGGGGEEGNRLLARVHNLTLHLSDLEGMIPSETSSEDSAQIINAYVERWVREAAMMYEAERNVPKDLNIDKLVRDYRASLIRNNYEKILVDKLLDSLVTEAQLQEYYELNKEQFPLESDIVRCRFVILPRSAPDINQFEKWWKSDKVEDFQLLLAYSNENAVSRQLDDSLWYSVKELDNRWPGGANELSNLKPGQKISRRDDNFLYFFQLNQILREKELAPIGYVADQMKKVILHQRKMKLLDATRENIYQDALRRNQVKVFSN
jgi:hypothetical protein